MENWRENSDQQLNRMRKSLLTKVYNMPLSTLGQKNHTFTFGRDSSSLGLYSGVLQDRCQDVAAGGPKNSRGEKTVGGKHF